MTARPPDREGARTTLQKLLSRFHFGITLFAVALSGITILLAGITTLRSYADHNIELAARLGAYGAEPALVFNDPQAAREGLEPLMRLPGIARLRLLDDRGHPLYQWTSPLGLDSSSWHADHADVREDRVVIYGSVSSDVREFVYRIRATNAGSFRIPPAYASAMYRPSVQAEAPAAGVLTVVRPK